MICSNMDGHNKKFMMLILIVQGRMAYSRFTCHSSTLQQSSVQLVVFMRDDDDEYIVVISFDH
ncbi:hypothetical protein DERP_000752 [Dermatophagoides pteronyssinus]|uniref:Uncharacterized protein n=1 Tax=Dermatophagoides pteronyssinus TaxID=6956 RepID=A0ABQ8J137_DERPT|nr:hypothetical protein DERP_000752 [Dermatophagoides pteronyssinus]